MRAATILVIVVALSGCTAGRTDPGFSITPSDDRFSTSAETTLRADGCRAALLDIHGDYAGNGLGLYLDPLVYKSKDGGKVSRCALAITNSYAAITGAPLADTLGYIRSVSMNADGTLIELEMHKESDAFKSHGGGHIRHDFASGDLSEKELRALATSKTLAIKIAGTHRTRTIEDRDLDPAWREKIRRFIAEAVDASPAKP